MCGLPENGLTPGVVSLKMVQIDVVKIFYHGVIFHKKWSYKWDGLIKTGLQEGWFFSVQNGLMGGGGVSH